VKKQELKVQKRKTLGRQVKQLRQEGILPANIYGKEIKSQSVKVGLKDFIKVYKKAGETGIVDLFVGKNKKPYSVLVHNLQRHPVSGQLLHVDFYKVDLTKKVQVAIPIELKGQAPGETKGGILVQFLNEVEVEALPADLPEKFEIDISGLKEIGDSIEFKDLKIDKEKVKPLADQNELVVKVEEPQEEEEEEKLEEGLPSEEPLAEEAAGQAGKGEPAKTEPGQEKKQSSKDAGQEQAKKKQPSEQTEGGKASKEDQKKK